MLNMLVRSFAEGAFNWTKFSNLEVLYIENTHIEHLYRNSFIGLTNLKELVFKHVDLITVNDYVLTPTPNLEKFTLEHCGEKMTSLMFFRSVKMFHLKVVDIQFCNLNDTITLMTFYGLCNVTELLLVSNQITNIGPHSFDNVFESVEFIDLSSNNLTSLSPNIFKHPRNEQIRVDLDENPWHCDCKLESLRQFIKFSKDRVKLSLIKCHSPSKNADQFLHDLKPLCDYDYFGDFWTTSMTPSAPILSTTKSFHLEQPFSFFSSNQQSQSSALQTLPTSLSNSPAPQTYKEQFSVKCGVQPTSGKLQSQNEVLLTKSNESAFWSVRIENGQLIVDTKFESNDFSFVGFELNGLKNTFFDTNKKHTAFFVKGDLLANKTRFGRKLKPNQIYRFCWIQQSFTFILPTNCMTYHMKEDNDEFLDETWISMEEKMGIIIFIILIAIFAWIAGIFIAFTLALVFPKRVLKQKPMPKNRLFIISKRRIIKSVKRASKMK